MKCEPRVNVDLAKVAFPATSVSVANVIVTFLKVTETVGVPAPGATGATVTLKVTVWPNIDGLSDEVMVVEVAACVVKQGQGGSASGDHVGVGSRELHAVGSLPQAVKPCALDDNAALPSV